MNKEKITLLATRKKSCFRLDSKTKRMLFVPEGKFEVHSCKCCSGSGMMKCPRCGGTGRFNDGSRCYYCGGNGKVTCSACNGKGIIED